MKKKNINHSSNFGKVILGVVSILIIFSLLAKCSNDKINADRKELDEMRVYHSDKGLVEVNDGYLIIKIQ